MFFTYLRLHLKKCVPAMGLKTWFCLLPWYSTVNSPSPYSQILHTIAGLSFFAYSLASSILLMICGYGSGSQTPPKVQPPIASGKLPYILHSSLPRYSLSSFPVSYMLAPSFVWWVYLPGTQPGIFQVAEHTPCWMF